MSVLTKDQRLFLSLFSSEPLLFNNFYLTGGTALAEHYIPYRYSDDLDFFSETEVDTSAILATLKKFKDKLNFNTLEFNTLFNRNLFFLVFDEYSLKTEFTYFPFPRIEKLKPVDNIQIDSALDIAVNKLFTIYQKPRSRDFMDLYMLCDKYSFKLANLISLSKAKFDWHIDPIKLGAQFLFVTELKDYPNLIEPLEESRWQRFFIDAAKDLKSRIFG